MDATTDYCHYFRIIKGIFVLLNISFLRPILQNSKTVQNMKTYRKVTRTFYSGVSESLVLNIYLPLMANCPLMHLFSS